MRYTRRNILSKLQQLALVASVACLPALAQAQASITIKDMAGRSVTVPEKVDRIVGLGPGALRLISYLQATDKVVGVEDMEKSSATGRPYWIANPQMAKLPRSGPGGPATINKKPDLEALLSVRPQVIFVTYMDAPLVDEVQKTLGIPVVLLDYGALGSFNKTVYDSLRVAGKVLKKEQRAEAVVSFIQSLQQDLAKRAQAVPAAERASAYLGGVGMKGSHGIGSSEKSYVPFAWAGVNNLAQQVQGGTGSYVNLDKEALLKLNPEVMFIDGSGTELIRQDYGKNPDFYKALRAVSSGRVYTLYPYNMYTTNIDTALADAYAVGKVLYPKQFADVDIAAKANSIYQFLVGKPVYQQMEKDFGALGKKVVFGQ